MKKKVLGIAIVIALGMLVVYGGVEWWKAKAAKEAEIVRAREEIKTAVADLASRYNAVTDWETRLGNGKRDTFPPVLTIELEQAWLNGPVLFFGSIMDVSSIDTDTYEVLVEQGVFGAEHLFRPDLRLSLRASKATIDSFLQTNPNLFEDTTVSNHRNGIALVAKIAKVSSREGDVFRIRTGHELLGLAYTSDVYFLRERTTSDETTTSDE